MVMAILYFVNDCMCFVCLWKMGRCFPEVRRDENSLIIYLHSYFKPKRLFSILYMEDFRTNHTEKTNSRVYLIFCTFAQVFAHSFL